MSTWLIEKKNRTIIKKCANEIDSIFLPTRKCFDFCRKKWSYTESLNKLIFPLFLIRKMEKNMRKQNILINGKCLKKEWFRKGHTNILTSKIRKIWGICINNFSILNIFHWSLCWGDESGKKPKEWCFSRSWWSFYKDPLMRTDGEILWIKNTLFAIKEGNIITGNCEWFFWVRRLHESNVNILWMERDSRVWWEYNWCSIFLHLRKRERLKTHWDEKGVPLKKILKVISSLFLFVEKMFLMKQCCHVQAYLYDNMIELHSETNLYQ